MTHQVCAFALTRKEQFSEAFDRYKYSVKILFFKRYRKNACASCYYANINCEIGEMIGRQLDCFVCDFLSGPTKQTSVDSEKFISV